MKYMVSFLVIVIGLCLIVSQEWLGNEVQGAFGQVRVTLDDSEVAATYANYVDVIENPQELVFDFALVNSYGNQKEVSVKPFRRIVVNFYTAKRLMGAVEQTVARQERNFGIDDPNSMVGKVNVDGDDVQPRYANFCRVTGTPEEMLIDLLMNPNPFSKTDQVLKITDRIVLNYSTSKDFLKKLKQGIENHEKKYGGIELDVHKRLKL